MRWKGFISLLAAGAVASACFSVGPEPVQSEGDRLSVSIEFPQGTFASKADVGEIPASAAENAVYSLGLWVFEHETKEPVTEPLITSELSNLPSAGGVRKYALPVSRQFILSRPKVDVFVLINAASIGCTLDENSTWQDLNTALFGGDAYFSPVNPVQTVPSAGLPMSGVGLNLAVTGEEPSLTVPKISVGRSVSKLRYVFSQMYTENSGEEYAIERIVLSGGQIPRQEFVFSPGPYHIYPADYESAAMETPWPEGQPLASSDSPELYSYAGQDGPTYEQLLQDGIATGQLTDCGTYYLRESDRALTGTVYYCITTKGEGGDPDVTEHKSLPFSMAAAGDFARNHTWTLYGYFISNRTLQLGVSVVPWDKNNYTIEFSTSSLQVTQKFTVLENSATVMPSGVSNHYNVFLDANKAAKGYLYVTTPQGGKLEVIPEGSVSDLAAFEVEPKEATINPAHNSGRIDISIDRNRSYSGDPSGKTITLSFKAYTPDGDREISGASECIDQIYHFYL